MHSPVTKLSSLILTLGLLALRCPDAVAAPFDLAGPTLEVEVTRGARTLPVARAPDVRHPLVTARLFGVKRAGLSRFAYERGPP